MTDVAEVLLTSPELKHLGISFVPEAGLDNDFLCMLISDFHRRRQERHQPLLQLESLHLGIGTMPWVDLQSGPTTDYIKDLTNLTYLTSLRLDNMHYFPFYGPVVPYKKIGPSLFRQAINLRNLSVERFGPDILLLVDLLKEVQCPQKLDTLEVLQYGQTLEIEGQDTPAPWNGEYTEHGEYGEYGEPIYSVPLYRTGYTWRRLCYSGPVARHDSEESLAMSRDLLRSFVARCTALEELMVPIHTREEFNILKTEVLPSLHRLHTLHLPWGYLADFLSNLETPWHDPYQLLHLTEEEKERLFQKDRELDREQEKSRISLIHELFQYHLQLELDQGEISLLLHIAINRDVYARMWTGQNRDDLYHLEDGSSIIRLPQEEARGIGIVENLYGSWSFDLPSG